MDAMVDDRFAEILGSRHRFAHEVPDNAGAVELWRGKIILQDRRVLHRVIGQRVCARQH